jgi:shikimate dehydrogenase
MSGNIDRYAVFGDPVAHSMSPFIHARFAEQTGEKLSYTAERVAAADFEAAVAAFAADGGKGLNITVPHKESAWALATSRSPRAQRAGAVNTLVLHGPNDYFGDNTDGIGLVRDLVRNHHVQLQHRRILLIGAGGAVRGVLEPLLNHHPVLLLVANRTREKALQLAGAFSDLGRVRGCGLADIDDGAFDVIINGTSASLGGELPTLPDHVAASSSFCYDMVYAREPTPFMRWAEQHGSSSVDGIGMLVEQAAESFRIWRGREPETAPVIEALKQL